MNTKIQIYKWAQCYRPWICELPNGRLVYCETWAGAMRVARDWYAS